MALNIVVATKTTDAGEQPKLLYLGNDGVEALKAAKDAQDSGGYIHGRIKRQVIYTWIPCPTVPVLTTQKTHETMKKPSLKRGLVAAAVACAMLLLSSINSLAQTSAGTMVPTYGPGTVTLGVASVAAGATSNLTTSAGIIDARYFQNLGLQLGFNLSSNETTAVVLTFAKSVDGSNWGTVGTTTWSVTANSTNMVYAPTNFVVGGLGYYKLQSIQNAASVATLTNISLTYGIKRSAP